MSQAIFNKSDYGILSLLKDKECFSEISSLNIKQISSNTNLSIPKIRIVIKNFLLMELIKEGAKDGISKTYYITEKGVNFFNNALGYTNNESGEDEE